MKGIEIQDYSTQLLEETFRKLFIGLHTGFLDPYLKSRSQHKRRAFTILDEGDWEDTLGYWVQDRETLDEGFFDVVENTFWSSDEHGVFAARKFKRFKLKRGKFKKRKGGKGSGRRHRGKFRSHKGYGKGKGKSKKGKGKGKGFYGEDGLWYEPVNPEAAADFGKGGKGKRKGKPGKGKGKDKGESDGKGTKGADAHQAANSQPSAPADQSANWEASGWEWNHSADFGWDDSSWHQSYYGHEWQEESWNDGPYPAETSFIVTHFETTLIVGEYEIVQSKRSWNEIQCSAMHSSINHYDLVDMRKSPQYAILDSGCTKTMGSMLKVMQFVRFASANCPWIRFNWVPARTKFSFANSHSAMVWWCLQIIYDLNDGQVTLECMVLEQGSVPILVSNALMGFLEIDVKNRVNSVWITSHTFGYNSEPMQYSTSNHQIVDLTAICNLPSAVKQGISGVDAFEAHAINGAWATVSAIPEHLDDVASATDPGATALLVSQLKAQSDSEIQKQKTHSLGLACRSISGPLWHSYQGEIESGEDELFEPSDILDPEVVESAPRKGFLRRYPARRVQFDTKDDGDAPIDPTSPIKSTGSKAEPSVHDISLKRIHNKLSDSAELLKLHLKHYHMTTEQFKKRTSQLQLPKEIYQKYDDIVKKCDACQRNAPVPTRSRVSGLRAEVFGDLVFIDHGEIEIEDKKYLFLICLDAASTLVTAYPYTGETDKEAMEALREFFHHNYVVPKNICADHKFMGPTWETFYNDHNINPIALGPKTPWPNRAEAAVRLYKRYIMKTVAELKSRETLKDKEVSVRTILREACYARNLLATYGGKTPIELAFGRRPPDVVGWDNATVGQLTNPGLEPDEIVKEIRSVAMQEYLKARQAEDIRNDLASSLRHIKGPFKEGERVWYWTAATYQSGQILKKGYWVKGKIVKKASGPMYIVDFGTRVLQVNASLLRKDADLMTDVVPIPDIVDTSGKDVATATLKVHKNPQSTASVFQLPVQVSRYHTFVPKLDQLRRRVTLDVSDPKNPVEIADEDVTGWSDKHLTHRLPEPRPRKIKTIFYFQGEGPEQSPENKAEERRQRKAQRQQVQKEPQVIPDEMEHDDEPGDDEHSEAEPEHADDEDDKPDQRQDDEEDDEENEPEDEDDENYDELDAIDKYSGRRDEEQAPIEEDPPRRRSARLQQKKTSAMANPLQESELDMELDDASASFQHVLWQCQMTGKIDLLELFAGSARVSQAAAEAGLRVGQPIDIRTGFDLMTKQGQKRVMQLILEQNPDVIFMAPVCSPWSLWSNMKDPETRHADREAIMPMVRFVVQIAMLQIKKGRHFIIENPKDSAIWYTLVMQQLSRQRGVTYGDLDFCAYGLKDPVSDNLYYRKSTSLMHNFGDGIMDPLWKRCPNNDQRKQPHKHQPVEGAAPGYGPRSKLSQIYPYRFCKTLADILGLYLRVPRRDKTAMLIEDILDIAFPDSGDDSIQCINALVASATQELDVTDRFSTTFQAMSTDCVVVDDATKAVMVTVNSLPKNTEILIHECQHLRLGQKLLRECKALREHWLPHHHFTRCSVFRGTWGTSAPIGSHDDESFIFLWKKNATKKTLSIYSSIEFQQIQSTLDPAIYSGVYFYADAGHPSVRTPPGHMGVSSNPFAGSPPAPAGHFPDHHHPRTFADPNVPITFSPHPDSPVPVDNHPTVAPPGLTPTPGSASTRLGGESRSTDTPPSSNPKLKPIIKDRSKLERSKSTPPPKPKASQPTPPTPPPGLGKPEPELPRSRTPPPPRGRSPPRDNDHEMDQFMDDRRPRMTAVKTKPAPRRSPTPFSRSRSRDDSPRRPERSRSRSDDSRQRDRSRSRDDSPPDEPPRERSRSRDNSRQRERSRSRDDDQPPLPPPRSPPGTDASRSRDSSVRPRSDASRSRDGSPVPERYHLPSGDSSTPPVPSSSLDEDDESESITGDELAEYTGDDIILSLEDSDWSYLTEGEKMAANTGSFSHVGNERGDIYDLTSHVATATVQTLLSQPYRPTSPRCVTRQKHDLRQQMDFLSE